MARQKVTIEQIRQVVLDHYVETGEPLRVVEIAEKLGCSGTTVRVRLEEGHGLDWTQVPVPVRERNYGTVARTQWVSAYGPSKMQLLARLRETEAVLMAERERR